MTAIPASQTQEISRDDPSTEDDITHWYCCVDVDLLMCGQDGRGMRFDESTKVECVACSNAHEHAECPKWGRCPTDEDNLN